MNRLLSRAAFAALLIVAAGCGGSSSGSPSSPTAPSSPTTPSSPPVTTTPVETTTEEYVGTFAHGNFTGTVSMSAAVPRSAATAGAPRPRPRAVATATGEAKYSGMAQQTFNLTGTYDTTARRFSLRGGPFVVDATVSDETATGTVVTPSGTAGVAALLSSAARRATRYCGTFRGTETGKFTIIVSGSRASGVAAQDGEPESIALSGGVTGSGISLNWSWPQVGNESGGRGTASGTINASFASGDWSNTDNQRGTWSAAVC